MAILRDMLAQRTTGSSTLTDLQPFVRSAFDGEPSLSGINVSEERALQVTAVYACVRLLTGAFASLPLHVYRRTERGKERATDHPLYTLLHDEPNPEMTSFQWREAGLAGDLLWGNAYAAINFDARGGRVASLYPITPVRVTPVRSRDTGELYYDILMADGRVERFASWQILHVPGLGFDGLVGKSPIRLMQEAVGLSMVTERHGAAFFGKGARPGVVLKHPKPLARKAVESIKQMWVEDHGGLANSHGVSVLGEGMDVSSFSIPNNHAQFLETRGFQVVEIARMFGVQSWMINDSTGGTAWPTAIENIGIIFITHSLRPWLVRWEQAIRAKCFTTAELKAGYFVEFAADAFLRGDTSARYQAYASGITNGWLNRNEVRQLENLNAEAGLDDFLTPSGGNAMKPATGNPRDAARAFVPLFRETWARIFRRDRNDRLVAEKKGQTEAWLEQQLAYAREQIGAVVEAFRAAGGECSSAAELVAAEYVLPGVSELDTATLAEAATERTLYPKR